MLLHQLLCKECLNPSLPPSCLKYRIHTFAVFLLRLQRLPSSSPSPLDSGAPFGFACPHLSFSLTCLLPDDPASNQGSTMSAMKNSFFAPAVLMFYHFFHSLWSLLLSSGCRLRLSVSVFFIMIGRVCVISVAGHDCSVPI